MAREAISAASASAMTLSFSYAASALRHPAFSSSATSSSVKHACDGVDYHLPGFCIAPQWQAD
jgi:hypothetical protein